MPIVNAGDGHGHAFDVVISKYNITTPYGYTNISRYLENLLGENMVLRFRMSLICRLFLPKVK